MDKLNILIEEILELKENIINEEISAKHAIAGVSDIDNRIKAVPLQCIAEKSNALKSLMIVFNITNFSDMSVLFSITDTNIKIIEETGNNLLCRKIEEFIKDDPDFYYGLEKLEIGGSYYRFFYESMTTDSAVYILISLSLSQNFRSTRFHILSDIIMDYLKSAEKKGKGIYNDLFDYTVIELTKFISLFEHDDPVVFFFRYEYISEFFSKSDLLLSLKCRIISNINYLNFSGVMHQLSHYHFQVML
jgi:hypothetical protein